MSGIGENREVTVSAAETSPGMLTAVLGEEDADGGGEEADTIVAALGWLPAMDEAVRMAIVRQK